jgi:hypothetical protein
MWLLPFLHIYLLLIVQLSSMYICQILLHCQEKKVDNDGLEKGRRFMMVWKNGRNSCWFGRNGGNSIFGDFIQDHARSKGDGETQDDGHEGVVGHGKAEHLKNRHTKNKHI